MLKFFKTISLVLATLTATVTDTDAVTGKDNIDLFFDNELSESKPDLLGEANRDFDGLIAKLEEKRQKIDSDEAFIKYVFYYVHRKHLGEYKQYGSLGDIFGNKKQYDCVTGTALYALILDYFRIPYEIKETDYHIYMWAYSGEKVFLLESTDPLTGFSSDKKEIAKRRQIVLDDAMRYNMKIAAKGLGAKDAEGQVAHVLDNSVSLKQLSGLHYYNLSLKQLNERNFSEAYRLIQKAYTMYPSERVKATASLIFSYAFED